MPKITFFNLNIEKREKIKKAIINEFSKHTIAKASISNIVEEAQIPRGSFYQYFEDKEDALKYIIDEFIKIEKEEIKNSLKINNGDIFKTSIYIFKYVSKKSYNDTEMMLCHNIIQKLKEENVNIFEGINCKSMYQANKDNGNIINTNILKINNEEDLKYMMKILTVVIRASIIDVITKKKSEEKAQEELQKQIEILKHGMIK